MKISATVYFNGIPAGVLTKESRSYTFTYDYAYMREAGSLPIIVTMPFRIEPYISDILFPVFANLLSEGNNKWKQCRLLRIDENDYFGLLLAIAAEDTIGALTVKRIDEPA